MQMSKLARQCVLGNGGRLQPQDILITRIILVRQHFGIFDKNTVAMGFGCGSVCLRRHWQSLFNYN
jgi:hypothetical protein